VLEATAYQTRDVVGEAMEKRRAKFELKSVRVDGGMVVNELLMAISNRIF